MNAIVPQNFGQISSRFAATQGAVDNDLAAGVQAGFGLIGYRGKVWSIRHRGDETQLMRDDGDGPRGSIEVVVLKSSSHISKIFYENGYVEGSSSPPDCFSTNGITPDPSVANKRAPACANCPMNAWGSRVTASGKAGKACSDSKRLAVVPVNDIPNEVFGGPMLLRVPAASLQDLAGFGNKLAGLGYPYYAIATRISFDPAEAFPKFVFSAIRPLTDAEADLVMTMRDGDAVGRILAEGTEFSVQQPAQPTVQSVFEQPPVQQPVQQVVQQARPVVQAQPQVQAQPTQAQPASAAQRAFGGPAVSQPQVQAQPTQQASQPAVQQAEAQPVQMTMPEPDAAPQTDLEEELERKLAALLPG